MNSNRYDLTRIRASPEYILFEDDFPMKFDLNNESIDRLRAKQHYFDQRKRAHETLDELFSKINIPLLKGVNDFVNKATKDCLFVNNRVRIHAANVLLDMQTSDHDAVFQMIENCLVNEHRIFTQRISSNLKRKRNLLELLEASKKKKSLCIMIEQAETIDTCIAETLVGHLTQRLEDENSPTALIMILFCISSQLQDLPFESMGCFGKLATIRRNEEMDKLIVKDHLIRCPNTTMKLGYKVLDYVYECFTCNDASITNIKFIFDYALHLFCRNMSHSGHMAQIALFDSKLAQEIRGYHAYVCDQLYLYYELFRAQNLWPDDVTVLYEHLLEHGDLARSREFYDCVKTRLKIGKGYLMTRFERVEVLAKKLGVDIKGSVSRVIAKYKLLLENNEDDCDELSAKLVDDLLDNAKSLKSPRDLKGLGEAYYDDCEEIMWGTLECLRAVDRFRKYRETNQYFLIVLDAVLSSASQVSANDLWEEVRDKLVETIITDQKAAVQIEIPVKMKSTPKRKGRPVATRPKQKAPPKVLPADIDKESLEVAGLAKSIFLDMMSSLAHHHLINLVRKANRGLIVKRTFWQ